MGCAMSGLRAAVCVAILGVAGCTEGSVGGRSVPGSATDRSFAQSAPSVAGGSSAGRGGPGPAAGLDRAHTAKAATVLRFLDAYNAGNVVSAMRELDANPGVSACDYPAAGVIDIHGRSAVQRWLQDQARNDSRLSWSSIGTSNPSDPSLGVNVTKIQSRWLSAHGRPNGVRPPLGAKVQFAADGRISVFAMGPVGGAASMCGLP